MVDGDELQAIDEQRFFELVGHAKLVAAIAGLQLSPRDAHVFVRIGLIPGPGRQPGTHLAATHEVGHELEPRPFQVNRYGHDDGLRSSSVTVSSPGRRVRPLAGLGLQDSRRPQHPDDIGSGSRAETE